MANQRINEKLNFRVDAGETCGPHDFTYIKSNFDFTGTQVLFRIVNERTKNTLYSTELAYTIEEPVEENEFKAKLQFELLLGHELTAQFNTGRHLCVLEILHPDGVKRRIKGSFIVDENY
jgi:hypothetical protein